MASDSAAAPTCVRRRSRSSTTHSAGPSSGSTSPARRGRARAASAASAAGTSPASARAGARASASSSSARSSSTSAGQRQPVGLVLAHDVERRGQHGAQRRDRDLQRPPPALGGGVGPELLLQHLAMHRPPAVQRERAQQLSRARPHGGQVDRGALDRERERAEAAQRDARVRPTARARRAARSPHSSAIVGRELEVLRPARGLERREREVGERERRADAGRSARRARRRGRHRVRRGRRPARARRLRALRAQASSTVAPSARRSALERVSTEAASSWPL